MLWYCKQCCGPNVVPASAHAQEDSSRMGSAKGRCWSSGVCLRIVDRCGRAALQHYCVNLYQKACECPGKTRVHTIKFSAGRVEKSGMQFRLCCEPLAFVSLWSLLVGHILSAGQREQGRAVTGWSLLQKEAMAQGCPSQLGRDGQRRRHPLRHLGCCLHAALRPLLSSAEI